MKIFLWFLYGVYSWLFVIPVSWLWTILVTLTIIILTWLGAGAWADRYVARAWGRFVLWITPVKVKIHNQSVIQANQSYVIVANHQSIYDILVVYGYLPMVFKWVMKIELRKMPFVGYTCQLMGHIYVDRKNRQSSVKNMQNAADTLVNGTSVFFFPEGTRHTGNQLLPFKKGAFRMAETLALPILPLSIKGADKVMPAKRLRIRPGTIELFFHAPIETKSLSPNERANLIKTTQEQIAKEL